jgi:hypothetical protein
MLEPSPSTDSDAGQTEFLVLLEFTDSNEAKYSQEYNNNFQIVEVESKNPVLQIGNRLYSGEYMNNIGTYMFFEEQETNTKQDTFNSQRISYKGKTFKKLLLNRIYLDKKSPEEN